MREGAGPGDRTKGPKALARPSIRPYNSFGTWHKYSQ